jgi:hypothetical protein
MKSLHTESDRHAVVARVGRLTADTAPKWGRMTATQMVVHLADSARMATGELLVRSKGAPFRFPVLKQLLMYVMPIPKNLPTAPELLARAPREWSVEVADYLGALEAFASKDVKGLWAVHPVFGPLTGVEWGRQAHSHIDHHLRQFGV